MKTQTLRWNRARRGPATLWRGVLAGLVLLTGPVSPAAVPPEPVPLWPGDVPGETAPVGEEKDLTKPTDGLVAGRRLIRLGQVSVPTLRVSRPPADRDTGAAVLVCPAYLTVEKEADRVAPELRVTESTPPTFLVQTQDDSVRVETSLFYSSRMR
jgi:hypothetical protein